MKDNKIVLVSFADSRWSNTLNRLKKQALDSGFFNLFFLFNEKILGQDFLLNYSHILNKRGFGYWIWKSYIILKVLNDLKEDDLLIYLDAGCHINPKGKKRFNEYVNMVSNNDTGILSFYGLEKEYKWTKGDVFEYFDARNEEYIFNTGQIYAGCIFIRKCEKSLEIIKKWYCISTCNISLIDESPSVSENFKDFIENRFDQSVFSVLAKINNCSQLPDNEVYNYGKKWSEMDMFPFQARRDKSMNLLDLLLHRLSSPKRILSRLMGKS